MARRAEETENHWPGFVDVLSTIVMVVTFLLIILGIVIFVISKNISVELAASAQRVEEAQKALDEALAKTQQAEAQVADAQDASQFQAARQAKAPVEAQREDKAQEPSQSQNEAKQNSKSQANADASMRVYRSSLARELTQNVRIDGKEKHAVRTRQTDEVKQIAIVRTEKETEPRKVRVATSTAVLSLVFNGGIKITPDASEQIESYIKAKIHDKVSRYEIRSFYTADKGSISEARRMAYYRALATRNQLIKFGIKASWLSLKVANSSRIEDAGRVNVYLK